VDQLPVSRRTDICEFLREKLVEVGKLASRRLSRESVQRVVVVEMPELAEWCENELLGKLPTSNWSSGPSIRGSGRSGSDGMVRSWRLWACLGTIILGLLVAGLSLLPFQQKVGPSAQVNTGDETTVNPPASSRTGIERCLDSISKSWKCSPDQVASAVNHARDFDRPEKQALVERADLLKLIQSDQSLALQLQELLSKTPNYLVFLEHDLGSLGKGAEKADLERHVLALKHISKTWRGPEMELRKSLYRVYDNLRACQRASESIKGDLNDLRNALNGQPAPKERVPSKFLSMFVTIGDPKFGEPYWDQRIKDPSTPLFNRQDLIICQLIESFLSLLMRDRREQAGAAGPSPVSGEKLLEWLKSAAKTSEEIDIERPLVIDSVVKRNGEKNQAHNLDPGKVRACYEKLKDVFSGLSAMSPVSIQPKAGF
jgi:hypothetical protein